MTTIHFLPTITYDSSYLLKLFYYLGLISITINRCKKSNHSCNLPMLSNLIILNNFFGGFIRDSYILHFDPFLFSEAAIPEIFFVLMIGLVYSWLNRRININKKCNNIINYIITTFDSLSLSSFISLAIDKCSDAGFNKFYAFLGGYVTACYGGVSTSLICSEDLFASSNIYYHIIVVLACIFYTIYANGYLICLLISSGLILEKIDYTALATNNRKGCIFLFAILHFNDSNYFYDKNSIRNKFKNFRKLKYLVNFKKVFIIFHRIRLC